MTDWVWVKARGWGVEIMIPWHGVRCKQLQSRLYFQLICTQSVLPPAAAAMAVNPGGHMDATSRCVMV